ncbi:hypothetical protein HMPREF1981_02424 [Bacteroides pyogenes F0041]|uniref:Uncharacterized protein n=1 Tax=Bacteroides pyogenes F0041 TaxID=1321819 RepID=U2DX66_9BACE|nr:hypothetical protein HMPREF1981_02424 [Bacteroides pyogenes F0041]
MGSQASSYIRFFIKSKDRTNCSEIQTKKHLIICTVSFVPPDYY